MTTDKNIGAAVASNLKDAMTSFSVPLAETDAAQEQKETEWMNTDWPQQLGYYDSVSEASIVIDAKATWTIGKGFTADPETTVILNHVNGNGFDTINTILENMIRVYHIGGDSYCEIINEDTLGDLWNLKPLDPAVMKHIAKPGGKIIRFEQISKVKGKKPKKFRPEQIFYLPRNRVADEMHGQSMIQKLAGIILKRNEAMDDWQRVLHRNVDPLWIFHLNTDNPTKIAKIKATQDAARGKGENMYVPQGAVVPEQVATAQNATLNPLPTIEAYNNYFYQAAGVPQIIVGGIGSITERAVSIAYLAFQQTIEEEQLFIEEQVFAQLGLRINLKFPASLQNDVLSDQQKDGEINIDPSQTTATEERA